MASKDTSALYQEAQREGLAIAFYRLPGTRQVEHIAGPASRKVAAGEKAFVFAPFDPSERPWYIAPTGKGSKIDPVLSDKLTSTSKIAFTSWVKTIISDIRSGIYEKVVAARISVVKRPADFSPATFFDKLCSSYPTAFVSLCAIPGIGIWIGASPEVLASQSTTTLTTYSLAGTKAIDDQSPWGEKEILEQGIVTDFITRKLTKATGALLKVKGPVTKEAGTLKHLLTTLTLQADDANLWQQVTKALHPTPAVAGMPQSGALKFIRRLETFDRRFYAGYLGPVHASGKTNIFVNLRCMEVTEKQLIFYAGCGITADSNPETEWLESERKINVLRSQL